MAYVMAYENKICYNFLFLIWRKLIGYVKLMRPSTLRPSLPVSTRMPNQRLKINQQMGFKQKMMELMWKRWMKKSHLLERKTPNSGAESREILLQQMALLLSVVSLVNLTFR